MMANSGSSRPADYILYARVALPEGGKVEGGTTGSGLQAIQPYCGLIASRPRVAAWSVASHACGGELDTIRDNEDLEWR